MSPRPGEAVTSGALRTAMEACAGLLDLVWPPLCAVCRAPGAQALCDACRAAFHPIRPPVCPRCGAPTSDPACRLCSELESRYFAMARSAGHYDTALRDALRALKYHGRRRLAAPLGEWLAERIEAGLVAPHAPDVVVAVPLHPSRERERGYNQSALVAEAVAARLGLPVREGAVRRVQRTRPQSRLPRGERQGNVRGAFAAVPGEDLDGRTVLLVDDVITTSHTVDDCARALTDCGARRVVAVSVARGG